MEEDVLHDLRLKLTKDSLKEKIIRSGYQKAFDEIAEILLNKSPYVKVKKSFI